MSYRKFVIYILIFFIMIACDESQQTTNNSGINDSEMNEVDAYFTLDDLSMNTSDQTVGVECQQDHPPLIMVHGFLAAGDTWSKHVKRLLDRGFCQSHLIIFDWNTLDRDLDHVSELDQLIDQTLSQLNVTQVDLMGHSAGGGLGYQYLEEAIRASKVRRYVHIGSFATDIPAGPVSHPVPTLNLWSPGDKAVEGADIPGAINYSLVEHDHYTVATSQKSFEAIYTFLYDSIIPTSSDDIDNREQVRIRGRALTLGENTPEANGRIDIWQLSADTGRRLEKIREVDLDNLGKFSDILLDKAQFYEMSTPLTSPPVRYFRPALEKDDPLVYIRTFPQPGTLAGLILAPLPLNESQSVLVIFNASQTFLHQRDSLTLDNNELLTAENASAENTTIALFVFDIGQDGQAGSNLALFDNFPFLAAIDYPLAPSADGYFHIKYQEKEIKVPAIPANEGVLVAVFP